MNEVILVIGAGSIGQAIARRVGAGKHVVLADLHRENADAAAEVMRDAGFDVSTVTADVSARESVHALVETTTGFGDVTGVIHAAGVSPSQAAPATILAVDLYGTALVLEEIGNVIARGPSRTVGASTKLCRSYYSARYGSWENPSPGERPNDSGDQEDRTRIRSASPP